VLKAQLVLLDLQVRQDQQVHKVLKVQLVQQDQPDQAALHNYQQLILGLAQITLMPIKTLDLVQIHHFKHTEQQVEQ
jgi:hypothetical protein